MITFFYYIFLILLIDFYKFGECKSDSELGSRDLDPDPDLDPRVQKKSWIRAFLSTRHRPKLLKKTVPDPSVFKTSSGF